MSSYIPLDLDVLETRAEAKALWRARQKKELRCFVITQFSEREWINFDAIADEYAKRKGSGDVYDHLRDSAYADLIVAFLRGEFQDSQGSKVMLFDESLAMRHDLGVGEPRFTRWLPPEELELLLQTFAEPLVVANLVLRHCWLPRALCQRWLEERGLEFPSYWQPILAVSGPATTGPNPQRAKRTAEGEQATDVASCPVTRDDFAGVRDCLPLLKQWAEWKYDSDKVPDRAELLLNFRSDFGRVRGISDEQMRGLRKEVASEAAKLGGAPMHKVHAMKSEGSTTWKRFPRSQVHSR